MTEKEFEELRLDGTTNKKCQSIVACCDNCVHFDRTSLSTIKCKKDVFYILTGRLDMAAISCDLFELNLTEKPLEYLPVEVLP